MFDFTYIGKIKRIDQELNEITISFDYLDPDDLYLLEELCKKQESHKFGHKKARVESQSHKLQKAWYGSLAEILKVQGILPDSKRLDYFDEEMRKSIFPSRTIEIDEKIVHVPKKLKELNNDERYKCVRILQERYDFVDWSKFNE